MNEIFVFSVLKTYIPTSATTLVKVFSSVESAVDYCDKAVDFSGHTMRLESEPFVWVSGRFAYEIVSNNLD